MRDQPPGPSVSCRRHTMAPLPPRRVTAPGRPRASGCAVRGDPGHPAAGARPLSARRRGRPCSVVVFLHGGGWRMGSRRMLGPAYARVAPSPFEQVAPPASRSPASTTGSAARRGGRPSCTMRRPPSAGCAPAAGELGHRSRPDRRLGRVRRWPSRRLLGLTGPALDGDVGMLGPSTAVRAVAAWYAPSDLAALPGDLGTDPAAPDSREALLLGRPARQCARPGRPGQPDQLRLARRSAVPAAARAGRPADPVCTERTAAAALDRPVRRWTSTPIPAPTTCGSAPPMRRARRSPGPSTSCKIGWSRTGECT